ncbi:MAG: hypothetical protein QOD75_3691 [Blastocatellia bacterium]|jgi:HAMP domain-containing protein|nr:hypothetical protein [Blastocatellia bacterium]
MSEVAAPRANTTPRPNPEIEGVSSDSPQPDEWTIMCYTAGDATVSASMIAQLKELTDAGFQESTNVLVYFDPNCNGRNARIFDVNNRRKKYSKEHSKKGTVIGDADDPYVRNIAEDCDTQDLQQLPAALTLRYFLEYSRTYYPARNYMLFLMGHGIIVGNDQFLPDDDDGSSVTLSELGKILKNFGERVRETKGEFHLVAFHSCGMSSVELAFELQGSARYMMGTQGSAFPGSWPYRQLLKKVFNAMAEFGADPTLSSSPYPNKLVRAILKGLQNLSFYNAHDFWHAGFSADLCMCSLDKKKVGGLKQALQSLVAELKEGLKQGAREPILLAHLESQSYFGESYTDLYDFCECLQKYCPEDGSHNGIWKACMEVRSVLETSEASSNDPKGPFDQLVVFSDYYGPAYQHSNGLSIFFPWKAPVDKVMTRYEDYEFTKELEANSWMSFLDEYFFATKRPVKGFPEVTKEESGNRIAQSPVAHPLEKLSDEQILLLGPPPRHREFAVAKWVARLQKELATLAERVANLDQGTRTPAETNKETGMPAKGLETLQKELGSLAKELGSLAASGQDVGTLAKELGSLAKELGSLSESEQVIGTPGKELGSLAKELGSLAKELGSLGKDSGSLSKEFGSLSKELGSLAKELATLGFFGITAIKNFDSPGNLIITSRPGRRTRRDLERLGDYTPG